MRVPKENLLGKVNEGFKDVLSVLTAARIGMAALAVGIAQGALDESLNYARKRRQFGKPILDRIVRYETSLEEALKCALVSLDSTMRSNLSVGPPIDLLLYRRDAFVVTQQRRLGDRPRVLAGTTLPGPGLSAPL